MLERVLFKGKVRFLAVNVEGRRPDPATAALLVAAAEGRGQGAAAAAAGTSSQVGSRLQHAWMGEDGVRALQLSFVPNRLILHRGRVVRWWDGTGGKVVDGRHGASRANNSNELADEIARCLKLDAAAAAEKEAAAAPAATVNDDDSAALALAARAMTVK